MATQDVITEEQVRAYHEHGFVVVEDIFSTEDLALMRQTLDELIESARGLTDHTEILDLEPSHTPDAPKVRRIKSPFENHPVYRSMGKHPKLLAVLRALIGNDLRMHGSKINLKSAKFGSPVEWHQDWAFYPHTNDDVLAVGVMLDDMTEDNGPLLCIPGSHKGPTFDHHQDGRFVGAMDPDKCDINLNSAVPITGKAGSCSFHHVRMVHGSGMNTSSKDRRLMLYQVAAADAWDIRGMGRVGSWDNYVDTMISGEPTNEPRTVSTPIRLPFPEPEKVGSIYESQTLLKNKYFSDDQSVAE